MDETPTSYTAGGAERPVVHGGRWGNVSIFRGQATGRDSVGQTLWQAEAVKLYQWQHTGRTGAQAGWDNIHGE
eukprot:947959-Rhodomonas_salina.1